MKLLITIAFMFVSCVASAQVVIPPPVAVAVPQPPVYQWYQPQPYMWVTTRHTGPFGILSWYSTTAVPVQPIAPPYQQPINQAPVR